jgi:hypothetical protein
MHYLAVCHLNQKKLGPYFVYSLLIVFVVITDIKHNTQQYQANRQKSDNR